MSMKLQGKLSLVRCDPKTPIPRAVFTEKTTAGTVVFNCSCFHPGIPNLQNVISRCKLKSADQRQTLGSNDFSQTIGNTDQEMATKGAKLLRPSDQVQYI
eukprot:1147858-Pelagomonas_calceolata.AAC.13